MSNAYKIYNKQNQQPHKLNKWLLNKLLKKLRNQLHNKKPSKMQLQPQSLRQINIKDNQWRNLDFNRRQMMIQKIQRLKELLRPRKMLSMLWRTHMTIITQLMRFARCLCWSMNLIDAKLPRNKQVCRTCISLSSCLTEQI